jgi:hypothetical protein
MSWYIEVELFGRVVHEVPVSDNRAQSERCYRRARIAWERGEAVTLEVGDLRLASYFHEDVTGLRLRPFEERAAA